MSTLLVLAPFVLILVYQTLSEKDYEEDKKELESILKELDDL